MEKDLKYLRILGTINYVFAGLLAVVFILPLMYFNFAFLLTYLGSLKFLTKWILGGVVDYQALWPGDGGPEPIFMYFVSLFGLIFGLVLLVSIITTFYLGKSLRTQRNHLFCLIMSAINATSFPIGTAIGVPTLIILMREPVKEYFNRGKLG